MLTIAACLPVEKERGATAAQAQEQTAEEKTNEQIEQFQRVGYAIFPTLASSRLSRDYITLLAYRLRNNENDDVVQYDITETGEVFDPKKEVMVPVPLPADEKPLRDLLNDMDRLAFSLVFPEERPLFRASARLMFYPKKTESIDEKSTPYLPPHIDSRETEYVRFFVTLKDEGTVIFGPLDDWDGAINFDAGGTLYSDAALPRSWVHVPEGYVAGWTGWGRTKRQGVAPTLHAGPRRRNERLVLWVDYLPLACR